MADLSEGLRINSTERRANRLRSGIVSPILAGLGLAAVLGLLTYNFTLTARLNEVLIFAAGALAAVLVLRLLVQRERRMALQRWSVKSWARTRRPKLPPCVFLRPCASPRAGMCPEVA